MGGDSSWNESEVDSFLFRKGLDYIRDRPVSFVVRGFGKVFHTMASDASTFGMHRTYGNLSTVTFRIADRFNWGSGVAAIAYATYSTLYRFLFVLNNAFYYSSFAFMLLILFRHRWHWSAPELAYMGVIILTCALSFVLFGNSRFKEPIPSLTLILFMLEATKASAGRVRDFVRIQEATAVQQ